MTTEEMAAETLTALVRAYVGAEDRNEVQCPRETSPMTPCVARDGKLAVADAGVCVGCGHRPTKLVQAFEDQHPQSEDAGGPGPT